MTMNLFYIAKWPLRRINTGIRETANLDPTPGQKAPQYYLFSAHLQGKKTNISGRIHRLNNNDTHNHN